MVVLEMPKGKTKIARLQKVISEKPSKAQVMTASAGLRHATVAMKRVTGGRAVVSPEVETRVLEKLEETDGRRGAGCSVPLETEKAAIVAYAGGASDAQLEAEFALNTRYVKFALRRRFGNVDTAKRALQGLVMENAIACMAHGGSLIGEMSGPQAIMSGAILVDKALALEKSMEGGDRVIDFNALSEMGKTLKILREVATVQKPAAT